MLSSPNTSSDEIVVLGATGMLGHRLFLDLLAEGFRVIGTLRGPAENAPGLLQTAAGTPTAMLIGGVDVMKPEVASRFLKDQRPDVVINCVGLVKQLDTAADPLLAIPINALFPHQLARTCGEIGARLIHFSTDCVFSGHQGPYDEHCLPDPVDVYGRTKLLGEVSGTGCLTLRSSIIGHEIGPGSGLLSWIVSQRGGHVSGYKKALYSGVTTNFMGRVVASLLRNFPNLSGVWQLASQPINKFDLLHMINDVYDLDITIDPDESLICDRRLDGSALHEKTGIAPPPWEEMLRDMHDTAIATGEI